MAQFLGEWPLLLNLARAYLVKLTQIDGHPLPQAVSRLRRRLRERGVTALDTSDESQRDRAVSTSLGLSLAELQRLSQVHDKRSNRPQPYAWADRYRELAIFPKDINIPRSTLEQLWGQTARFDDLDVEDAVDAMRRLSLFTRTSPAQGTVRLHDVVRHYLIGQSTRAEMTA